MRMKQEQPGPFSDDPGKQERFDKEFLEKAKRRAQAVAEKNFNLRSKNIELGAYSKDELLFIFDKPLIIPSNPLSSYFGLRTARNSIIEFG